jgi:hypothetical protein
MTKLHHPLFFLRPPHLPLLPRRPPCNVVEAVDKLRSENVDKVKDSMSMKEPLAPLANRFV